jgi:hypothetical protein
MRTKKPPSKGRLFGFGWLPHQDSNLEKRYQKPVCYHYTMGQLLKSGAKINKAR